MASGWYKQFMAEHGFEIGGYKPRKAPPGPPMDLTNMRHNGVRSILISCLDCTHSQTLNVDAYAGDLPVKWFEGRMLCRCGSKRADVRPNWQEAPPWKP